MRNTRSVVITFEPHPRLVLNHGNEVKLLQSPDEKLVRFREAGIDIAIVIPFTLEFAGKSPELFIRDILVKQLKTCVIVTGHDHLFGRSRQGDFHLLEKLGAELHFEVMQVGQVMHCGMLVSSTAIRTELLEGNIKKANCMLGYPYTLRGKVVTGNTIGKAIGFPTANLKITDTDKLIPAQGVYASLIRWNANTYMGMSNIGLRPTIDANRLTIEANIFDFDTDIYGEMISIAFLERIRDEKKFANLTELKEQLICDKEIAEKLLTAG